MTRVINQTDIQTIREHADRVDTDVIRQAYRERRIPRGDLVQDIDRRHRWDIWWSLPADTREEIIRRYGRRLKDAHIDTALRSAVRPLWADEDGEISAA